MSRAFDFHLFQFHFLPETFFIPRDEECIGHNCDNDDLAEGVSTWAEKRRKALAMLTPFE